MTTAVHEIDRPDGAVVRVESAGDGHGIVALHGTFAGRASFSGLRPFLEQRHRVVTTSLRGHDGTPHVFPDDYGLASTEGADLAAVIDWLGDATVDLVGHSTGGAIALAFALAHPARIGRLVLIEPTVFSLLGPEALSRVTADGEKVVEAAARGEHRRAVAGVLAITGGDDWTNLAERHRDRTLDALSPVAEAAGPHVGALLDLDIDGGAVAALDIPMLLIYGGASMWFEPHIAAGFARCRPDAEQIIVEGATHNSHVERPDVVGPRIADFLSRD